jgi:hypothetical protein
MAASEYFEVEIDTKDKLVRIIRTERLLPTAVDEVRGIYSELARRLQPYAGYRALLDLRRVPVGRNDEAFEDLAVRSQTAMAKSFSRTAVLVRSAVGKLQLRRLTSGAANTFQDEAEALRFLREP